MVSEIATGNATAGASAASSGTKWNWLPHEQQQKMAVELKDAKSNEEKFAILENYARQSEENKMQDPEGAEVMEQAVLNELSKLTKYDNNTGVRFAVNEDLGLNENIKGARDFLKLSNTLSKITEKVFGESVILTVENIVENAQLNNLSPYKIQIFDTAGNIIQTYDRNDSAQQVARKVVIESAKGAGVYLVHQELQDRGISKSLIIALDIGIVIFSNFSSIY